MQNHVSRRILSATTLHGFLLLLGFVHYALLGGEGMADYASERSGGLFAIAVSGFAFVCLVGAYALRLQLLAFSVLTLSTTLIWVTLSEDGRAALSEPLTFAVLMTTFVGMWMLLLRLRGARLEDVSEARAMKQRRSMDTSPQAIGEKPAGSSVNDSRRADPIPWMTGTISVLWLLLPLMTLGVSRWTDLAGALDRATLGLTAGVTLAIVAIYIVTLEPMLYVRDVPGALEPKRALWVAVLFSLAACSLTIGWMVLGGAGYE